MMNQQTHGDVNLFECPKCKGTGEVFSGYFGHPETSDGGPVMYRCNDCNCSGKVSEKQFFKLTDTPDFF